MGWGSGTQIACDMIEAGIKYVPASSRVAFFKDVIISLEGNDWDCQGDTMGDCPEWDRAMYQLHPDWCHDDEDEPEDPNPMGYDDSWHCKGNE